MFKNILVATELVEHCDTPVLIAMQIAKQNDAKLHILHVLESETSKDRRFVKHFRTGEEIFCSTEYQETVKEEIQKSCSGLLDPGVHYEIKVIPGFPWEEISRWAKKEGIDLILLGPHTKRANELGVVRVSGTIGSTVQGVIMRERSPVMIVNQSMSKRRLKFKKVMVSIDFSKSCEYAFRFAIKLAQKHDLELFIFHMLPVPPSPKYSQAAYEAQLHTFKKKLETLCKEIPGGIEHEYSVWGGAIPQLEILKYANKKDVDLIVMGSHTKNKGGKWYVGSAVERVSFRSVCPVVVITDHKALSNIDG